MDVGCTLALGQIIYIRCGLHTSASRAVSAVAELLVEFSRFVFILQKNKLLLGFKLWQRISRVWSVDVSARC